MYYLADANSNVTALVNTSGTVVERYLYTPYGEVTVLDSDFSSDADGESDYSNTTLYTGRTFDSATGLYYYRHRLYHAQLGRFLTRDPIGYEDDVILYVYVANLPIDRTDPMGLQKWWQIPIIPPAIPPIAPPEPEPIPTPAPPTAPGKGDKPVPAPFPGFPPDDPDIVTSHTNLDIIVTNILKPGNACGKVQFKAIKQCNFTIKWTPSFKGGCVLAQALFKSKVPGGKVCTYLAEQAKKEGIHEITCPEGTTCCEEKKYWGTHNVTVSAKELQVPSQPCKVTFKLTANVGIVGELGVCKEDAKADAKK